MFSGSQVAHLIGVRAALSLALLAGACLAAPPAPDLSKDPPLAADAGGRDGRSIGCVSGSRLDLVYVDRIAVPAEGWSVALSGMAVFANPGDDTVLVADFSATTASPDPDLVANAALTGADAGLVLSPGAAKGALDPLAASVVRPALDERWVDTEEPSLAAAVTLNGAWSEDIGAISIPIQVVAGDYLFPIVVTLDPDDARESGAPVSAARATATCP